MLLLWHPNFSEMLALNLYFNHGYEYSVILEFSSKFHCIYRSLRTLKNRFKMLGLSLKSTAFDEQEIRARIEREINGPGCICLVIEACGTLFNGKVYTVVPRQKVDSLLKNIRPRRLSNKTCKSSELELELY